MSQMPHRITENGEALWDAPPLGFQGASSSGAFERISEVFVKDGEGCLAW